MFKFSPRLPLRTLICLGLVMVFGSISWTPTLRSISDVPAVDSTPATGTSAPGLRTCDDDPGNGYTRTITGMVDGAPLQIEVSSQFGGAVDSLTWRGRQFINNFDHGREISYAWGLDGYGECLNPTEPGSADDQAGPASTSRLLQVCRIGENELTTKTQPAYWLAPGESGFCSGGAATAVNHTVLSEDRLEKTIQIGYEGMENVISFTAVVTLPESYSMNNLEIPTGYLTYQFNNYFLYDPVHDELTRPESQPLQAPWSFEYFGNLPTILATHDEAYAMGAYTTEPVEGYGIYATNDPNPDNRTNKWTIVRHEQPAPAKSYTYRSFVIVGTLAQVRETMRELFRLHPVDFDPPTGYIDSATCDEIAGWAWDPKTPDQPIAVEFYDRHEDGTETLLKRIQADGHRADLVTALGDNGNHGFNVPANEIIQDNRPVMLRAYAINSNPRLPRRELYNSPTALTCPAFPPPAETHAAPTSESSPSPLSTPKSNPGLPCPSAVLPLAAGVILMVRRRRDH